MRTTKTRFIHRFKKSILLSAMLFLAACSALTGQSTRSNPLPTLRAELHLPGQVPAFQHIVLIVLENRDYKTVKDSPQMPYLNGLAHDNVLLTQYFAVAHPSLPNYLALIGGSTFGITNDCTNCFLNQPSLPDAIEKAGYTWKTYQESMPAPCTLGNHGDYVQKHNPFVYFDPIRTDKQRCDQHVVPLTEVEKDLSGGKFPNFAFISPNICNSGHNCDLKTVDGWLKTQVTALQNAPALKENSLIIITFDEGNESETTPCCGLKQTGGQVFTVLISPLAKAGLEDNTPLSHYSLLKTILAAWDLADIESTTNPATQPITAPWKK